MRRRRGEYGLVVLVIGYASVLAVAAVLAVLSRALMRPAAEPLHGDLALWQRSCWTSPARTR